jgi:hypothetical protein
LTCGKESWNLSPPKEEEEVMEFSDYSLEGYQIWSNLVTIPPGALSNPQCTIHLGLNPLEEDTILISKKYQKNYLIIAIGMTVFHKPG